jgi:glycogen operon protein
VAQALRAVVVDPSNYAWEDDAPLNKTHERAVIYEMHVAAFTQNPNSGVRDELRGTFRGVIEKIPYLVELGINTVELLPVAQFDPQDAPAGLVNYWGYSPIAFMAPHSQYAVHGDALAVVDEFRDMVKALHRAGIAVYLDVVFNHTTENGADGPTLCYRGLENIAYYIPGGEPAAYANYSGCGNTLNANHSIVRRLIRDSLNYWVTEMHVDGFRFDLASALSRGEFGEPLASPPILWAIESDPVLAGTAIIAEAWDAGGLYQVGTFIGDRFAEWNGQFRDDVRSFVKGDPGLAVKMALRMAGSPDLYPRTDRNVHRTVNFITSHDGFTLNDLVSYNEKHNSANGEHNRDGHNDNRSWNSGAEGPTDDPAINSLRMRQIKNFLTILFVAQGTPMLLMGDEVRRTQQGNNNAYGQNNAISWFDWDDLQESAENLRFTRELLRFYHGLEILHASAYLPQEPRRNEPSLIFHGRKLGKPEWGSEVRWLAFTLTHPAAGERLHVVLNAFWEPLNFELPRLSAPEGWRRVIATSAPPPQDILPPEDAPEQKGATYQAPARSVTVFRAWPTAPL